MGANAWGAAAHAFAPIKNSKQLTVSELETCKVLVKKWVGFTVRSTRVNYQGFSWAPSWVLGFVPLKVVLALRIFLDFVGLCKGRRY